MWESESERSMDRKHGANHRVKCLQSGLGFWMSLRQGVDGICGRKLVQTSGEGAEGPIVGGGEHKQEGEARMVGDSTTERCTAGALLPRSALTKAAVRSLRGAGGVGGKGVPPNFICLEKVMLMIYTFKIFYSKFAVNLIYLFILGTVLYILAHV